MDNLTKNERAQIKSLLQSPYWGVIERIIKLLCYKIRNESALRSTEWETLQTTLMNEGQIQGLNRFVGELIDHASKTD